MNNKSCLSTSLWNTVIWSKKIYLCSWLHIIKSFFVSLFSFLLLYVCDLSPPSLGPHCTPLACHDSVAHASLLTIFPLSQFLTFWRLCLSSALSCSNKIVNKLTLFVSLCFTTLSCEFDAGASNPPAPKLLASSSDLKFAPPASST